MRIDAAGQDPAGLWRRGSCCRRVVAEGGEAAAVDADVACAPAVVEGDAAAFDHQVMHRFRPDWCAIQTSCRGFANGMKGKTAPNVIGAITPRFCMCLILLDFPGRRYRRYRALFCGDNVLGLAMMLFLLCFSGGVIDVIDVIGVFEVVTGACAPGVQQAILQRISGQRDLLRREVAALAETSRSTLRPSVLLDISPSWGRSAASSRLSSHARRCSDLHEGRDVRLRQAQTMLRNLP